MNDDRVEKMVQVETTMEKTDKVWYRYCVSLLHFPQELLVLQSQLAVGPGKLG